MNWLSPKNLEATDYNPQDAVEAFAIKYRLAGSLVLEVFNQVDPLHVMYDDNVDEYIGYAERFMKQLGEKKLKDMSDEEISVMVRNSFHPSQIGKFASEEDVKLVIQNIIEVKKSL